MAPPIPQCVCERRVPSVSGCKVCSFSTRFPSLSRSAVPPFTHTQHIPCCLCGMTLDSRTLGFQLPVSPPLRPFVTPRLTSPSLPTFHASPCLRSVYEDPKPVLSFRWLLHRDSRRWHSSAHADAIASSKLKAGAKANGELEALKSQLRDIAAEHTALAARVQVRVCACCLPLFLSLR